MAKKLSVAIEIVFFLWLSFTTCALEKAVFAQSRADIVCADISMLWVNVFVFLTFFIIIGSYIFVRWFMDSVYLAFITSILILLTASLIWEPYFSYLTRRLQIIAIDKWPTDAQHHQIELELAYVPCYVGVHDKIFVKFRSDKVSKDRVAKTLENVGLSTAKF